MVWIWAVLQGVSPLVQVLDTCSRFSWWCFYGNYDAVGSGAQLKVVAHREGPLSLPLGMSGSLPPSPPWCEQPLPDACSHEWAAQPVVATRVEFNREPKINPFPLNLRVSVGYCHYGDTKVTRDTGKCSCFVQVFCGLFSSERAQCMT